MTIWECVIKFKMKAITSVLVLSITLQMCLAIHSSPFSMHLDIKTREDEEQCLWVGEPCPVPDPRVLRLPGTLDCCEPAYCWSETGRCRYDVPFEVLPFIQAVPGSATPDVDEEQRESNLDLEEFLKAMRAEMPEP